VATVFGFEPPPETRTVGSLLLADPSGRRFAEHIHAFPDIEGENTNGSVPRIRTVEDYERRGYSNPFEEKYRDEEDH
jgi:hypothetical protein